LKLVKGKEKSGGEERDGRGDVARGVDVDVAMWGWGDVAM